MRLVAYLVPEAPPGPSVTRLRQQLADRLPEYMIPSAFVILPTLPVAANGKVDLAALPAPAPSRPRLDTEFVEPRDRTERELAAIWSNVLDLDRIGIHDNFFELGGHSLLATQVLVRVRRALQVDIPVRQMFEAPTIAGLAQVIAAESNRAG